MRSLLILLGFCAFAFADAYIFCYHRVGDDRRSVRSTNVSISELRNEFSKLKSGGYKVIPLEALMQKIKNNETITDKIAVLTIDDSYKSFYKNGLPLLKEYGYPFTLFVYVEAVEGGWKDYMSWEMVKETKKYGDIQFHSYAHHNLLHMNDEEIALDTTKGMEIFEKRMGYKPKYYAYPYGLFDERVKNVLKKAGFEVALSVEAGPVSGVSDRLALARTPIAGRVDVTKHAADKQLQVEWYEPKYIGIDGEILVLEGRVINYAGQSVKLLINGESVNVPLKDGYFEAIVSGRQSEKDLRLTLFTNDSKKATKIFVKE